MWISVLPDTLLSTFIRLMSAQMVWSSIPLLIFVTLVIRHDCLPQTVSRRMLTGDLPSDEWQGELDFPYGLVMADNDTRYAVDASTIYCAFAINK